MPPEALLTLRQFLMASASQTPDGKLSVTFRSDNAFLEIDLKGSEEPRATVLKIRLECSLYDFSFQDESDGTKRLSALVDFLLMHSHEKAFVIDELSRSFHPMLTQQLIKLFNEVHAEDGCQLSSRRMKIPSCPTNTSAVTRSGSWGADRMDARDCILSTDLRRTVRVPILASERSTWREGTVECPVFLAPGPLRRCLLERDDSMADI